MRRTVEQIMRVRNATAKCKAVCEQATAEFRASSPLRKPRDPAIVALCKPVVADIPFHIPDDEYRAKLAALPDASETDQRLSDIAKGRAA